MSNQALKIEPNDEPSVDDVIQSIKDRIKLNLKEGIDSDTLKLVVDHTNESPENPFVSDDSFRSNTPDKSEGNSQSAENLLILKDPTVEKQRHRIQETGVLGMSEDKAKQEEPLNLGDDVALDEDFDDNSEAEDDPSSDLTIGESPRHSPAQDDDDLLNTDPDFSIGSDPKPKTTPSPQENNTSSSSGNATGHLKSSTPANSAQSKSSTTPVRPVIFDGTPEELMSEETLSDSAAAFAELASVAKKFQEVNHKKVQTANEPVTSERVGGYSVEGLMRELLKPMLKEWLDAHLPSLVKWIVTEQIEKMIQAQMGVHPSNGAYAPQQDHQTQQTPDAETPPSQHTEASSAEDTSQETATDPADIDKIMNG